MTPAEIVYLVLYVIAMAGRVPYVRKVKRLKIIRSVKDTKENILLLAGMPLMILPLVTIFTAWLDGFSMGLNNVYIIIGGIGVLCSVILHNWTHIALGTNWTPKVEIHEKHALITSGPYKYIRHPMYSAFLLLGIAQGLLLDNWVVLAGGTLSFLLLYLFRIEDEEALMRKQFGKQYEDYMKRTGRLFPKF